MLTNSTAEYSTTCTDYEIGLRLEPQEVHPNVRDGARRPDHMGFDQTRSTVEIALAEGVRRRKLA